MPKQQLLVVGAHHTGTSVVARAIIEMGIFGGDPAKLLKHSSNPMKYWEREDVVSTNQAVLNHRCEGNKNYFHSVFPWHGFGCFPSEQDSKVKVLCVPANPKPSESQKMNDMLSIFLKMIDRLVLPFS